MRWLGSPMETLGSRGDLGPAAPLGWEATYIWLQGAQITGPQEPLAC